MYGVYIFMADSEWHLWQVYDNPTIAENRVATFNFINVTAKFEEISQ